MDQRRAAVEKIARELCIANGIGPESPGETWLTAFVWEMELAFPSIEEAVREVMGTALEVAWGEGYAMGRSTAMLPQSPNPYVVT